MANSSTSGNLSNEALAPGTVLQNRYEIERLLGGGGMGMVYLAHDQRLANRPCAVKEMVDHFIDPQQRIEANEYFAREADTLAQLKHSAIPAITDRFDDHNRHYLVMEYVEGRNLEEELAARGGPLPEGLVIDIARQLCDVLAYLHGCTPPIVYRDMKPSNVMLTPKGRVVLIDFGIARLFKSARKGTMIGTLGFAPPEQYQGAVDPRSDIYSLGATLHYVLTARDPEKFPPFSFPPVRDLRPETSTNLAAAIDAALAYQAEARPATIQDFRDMLLYGRGIATAGAAAAPAVSSRGGTDDLSLAAPPEPAEFHVSPHHRRRRRKHRLIALGVFSAVMAGAAFGATYVYNNPQLQERLGVKSFIDSLPWKVEERLAKAQEHPLDFHRLTLQLSTRSGTPLSAPRASFTNVELSNNRYLQWSASFINRLAGLKGQDEKVEARFYSPSGLQIASSSTSRFVGPGEQSVDFSSVALMPDLGSLSPGNYKVGLYVNSQLAAEQAFAISEDAAAVAAAAAAATVEKSREEAEQRRQREAAQRLTMLEERKRKPLQLMNIQFLNTTKSGTPLSAPSAAFAASKLLFVDWRVTFENRLFNLDTGQYRVDAAYLAPDGRTLGSVDDIRIVPPTSRTATFSGRVGNSAGGAFLPGQYTVNFYLNGQYVGQKKFSVVADASSRPYVATLGNAPPAPGGSIDVPTLTTGRIDGLAGSSNIPMELRLRPQPNGFLHGELVIHEPGYGATPIQGFIRGDHVEFQVPYGAKTLYFDGRRRADQLSGSFSATPSGERGTWTTTMTN